MAKNIILAGVARSGSTLACHLLNKVSNSVALHEPINPADLNGMDAVQVCAYIENFYQQERASILASGLATSKSHQGKVPDNPMGGVDPQTGRRQRILDGHQITVTQPLTDNFYLVIKQPGLFTGMLEQLVDRFDCYATIRNPLGILQSWNTVNMAVTQGHAPAAERCDPVLARRLSEEGDVYQRQLILLSWYFEQFSRFLPESNIIRYEQVIASGGAELARLVPDASLLQESLHSKNNNPLYKSELVAKLADLLLASEGAYWDFYRPADVVALREVA